MKIEDVRLFGERNRFPQISLPALTTALVQMEGSSSTVRQRTPHSTTDITIDEEPANTHSLAEVEFEIVDWDEEIRLARLSVADRMKRQGLKDDCLTEEEEDQKEKGEEVNKKDDDVERGAGASADADQPKAEPQIFTGNWKDDVPPVTEAKRETAEEEEESCRICFGGQEEELGRLFSPCLCRGTVSLVPLLLQCELLKDEVETDET
jgi:hypothetical protein